MPAYGPKLDAASLLGDANELVPGLAPEEPPHMSAVLLVELLEEAPVAVSVPSEWLRWRVFCLQRAQHRLQARMERAHARGDGHGDTAANSTSRDRFACSSFRW